MDARSKTEGGDNYSKQASKAFLCADSNFYSLGMVEVFGHWLMLIYSIFHNSEPICFKATIKIASWNKVTWQAQWITPSRFHNLLVHTAKAALIILQVRELWKGHSPLVLNMPRASSGQGHCSSLISLAHRTLPGTGAMFSGMSTECILGPRDAFYSFRQEVGGNSSLHESDEQIRGVM